MKNTAHQKIKKKNFNYFSKTTQAIFLLAFQRWSFFFFFGLRICIIHLACILPQFLVVLEV